MGFIKEPLDVDFIVDPRPLTDDEKEAISKYIRKYKARPSLKKKIARTSQTQEKQTV